MSVLQYPEGMDSSDLQIWNNAAFDNGDSEDLSALGKRSWSPLKTLLLDSSDSLQSLNSSKENHSPQFLNPSVPSVKVPSPLPLRVHNQNGPSKVSFVEITVSKDGSEGDEKKIDREIKEIEMEISRLSSRLEALKMQKAVKSANPVEKRGAGRVVPAKFMEEKNIIKNVEFQRSRRGLSLGPSDIMAGTRRGMSLGPSEIYAASKTRELGKKEGLMITPVQAIQNRRKSCFWKLQDIDEEKVTKERGKCLTVSPGSRKNLMAKTPVPRQAVTTVNAAKKTVKKEEVFGNVIQPKKLFKDGEKSVTATSKKPLRPGRVVASRYSQATGQASAMRKRSLPENDKDECKRTDKKRSLSIGKSSTESLSEMKNLGTESRVKKKWQAPSDIVIHSSESDDFSPTASVLPEFLPRIRTARCIPETPRDSGPAKRVADLIGRKPFFVDDDEEVKPLCQALNFADDDDDEVQAN